MLLGIVWSAWSRLASPRLDAELAGGEDPCSSPLLARRAAHLVTRRTRCQTAAAVECVCSERGPRPVFSAAIPIDRRAVEVARPALGQLAWALRSRSSVESRGVALTRRLLVDGTGPLYRPARAEELYEVARRALLALGPVAPQSTGNPESAATNH